MNRSYEQLILTPAAAAKRAGVSRPTITRALNNLDLKGHRDNRNRWNINTDDLDEWVKQRKSTHTNKTMNTDRTVNMNTKNEQLEHLRSDLMEAREKLAAATARADAAEADRDRWQSMAERLTDRPRRNWWPWSKT